MIFHCVEINLVLLTLMRQAVCASETKQNYFYNATISADNGKERELSSMLSVVLLT